MTTETSFRSQQAPKRAIRTGAKKERRAAGTIHRSPAGPDANVLTGPSFPLSSPSLFTFFSSALFRSSARWRCRSSSCSAPRTVCFSLFRKWVSIEVGTGACPYEGSGIGENNEGGSAAENKNTKTTAPPKSIPIKSWLEPTAEVYVVVNVPKLRRIEGLEQARENPISLYLTDIYEDSDRRFELPTSTM